MPLDDLIRSGVELANSITSSLQPVVRHSAYTGQNEVGVKTYAAEVNRPAIVEFKQRLLKTTGGQEVMGRAKITFLEPFDIDANDKLILPDGSTGPIVDTEGLVDPETNRPFMLEVWIGAGSGTR